MTEPLLSNSKLKNILIDNPYLSDRSIGEGELISYKGRKYAWLTLKDDTISLPEDLMKSLGIEIGDRLLAIRSSDIAFTMGAKGSLIQTANEYTGEIEVF